MKRIAWVCASLAVSAIFATALCGCSGNTEQANTSSTAELEDQWVCVQTASSDDGKTSQIDESLDIKLEDGQLLNHKYTTYDDGEQEIFSTTVLSYDGDGRLVEETEYLVDDESDTTYDDADVYKKTTYSYNDAGQLSESMTDDEDMSQHIYRQFDSNGTLVKESTYDVNEDGEEELYSELEFNSEGNETHRVYSAEAAGSFESEITTEYDEQGRVISCSSDVRTVTFAYSEDGSTRNTFEDGVFIGEDAFDKQGNLVSGYNIFGEEEGDEYGTIVNRRVADQADPVYCTLREYDENGRVVHSKEDTGEYFYEYDEHGLLVAAWTFLSPDNASVTTYDYVNIADWERVSGGDPLEKFSEHSWTDEKVSQKELMGRSRPLELSADKVYSKYDVTGDGEPDKLKFKRVYTEKDTSSNYDWCKRLDVYVNGEVAYSSDEYNYYESGVNPEFMVLEDGTPLLYLHLSSDNNDGPDVILKWNGSSFTEALDCDRYSEWLPGFHTYVENVSVSNNQVVVKHNVMTAGVGGLYFTYIYELQGNGLVRTDDVADNAVLWKAREVTFKKAAQLYADKECTNAAIEVMKGDKAEIEAAYLSETCCSLQLETSSGETGWVKIPTEMEDKSLFKECYYAG